MRSNAMLVAMLVCMACVGRFASAGMPTTDAGFNPIVNGTVRSLAVQANGELLLGGDFTQVEGLPRNRIARLHADGTSDTTFAPAGANDSVLAIAAQPDGKAVVAGRFTAINGDDQAHIARLNANGVLDAGFNPDVNAQVNALALQSDGKILIGGHFTQVNGIARTAIARLNANGTLDSSFIPAGMDPGNSYINAIIVQRDGKIVLGGFFERVGGKPHRRIARLNQDGSLDANFSPGADANSCVNAMAIQPDGKIILGGTFVAINGTYRRGIARINENGSLDTSFDPGSGADAHVHAVALQPDGKVLVGGDFITMNGETHRAIARLNVDGSLDAAFNTGADSEGHVYALAVQPDCKPLMAGDFTQVNGSNRTRLARLNQDGSLDVGYTITTPMYGIYAMALQADGKILGGGLTGNTPYSFPGKLIRQCPDGSADDAFNGNIGYNPDAFAMAVQPDGKIIVAGAYMGKTSTVNRLNANGTPDSTFQTVTVSGYGVEAIILQPDGKILVGGRLNTVNGVARGGLVRLNTDGSIDTSFNTGSTTFICRTLALQPDGKILVGGGASENDVNRLNPNGSVDTSFYLSTGIGGYVECFGVQPDGKIIVAGSFIELRSVRCNGIMRLHENGRRDPAFGQVQTNLTGSNEIGSVMVQANGKIIIHGMHQITDGVFKWNFYTERLNPDGTIDPTFGYIHESNGDRMGYGLALQPDGKILANNGQGSNILRYTNPDAALQKIVVNSGTVTWALGGSFQWPYQVKFEQSSDGENWSSLGWGTRVAGIGFQLSGSKLPANKPVYSRATGYFAGGAHNGSSWVQHSTARVYDYVQGAASKEWLTAE